MLQRLKKLLGYTIQAADGNIGKPHNYYFEDEYWIIRYLVVEIGDWLSNRQVFISTAVSSQPDRESQIFPVALTQVLIERSPDIFWIIAAAKTIKVSGQVWPRERQHGSP
jgi:hypothetical protein